MPLSFDLLWEMASLINSQGKPCYHHDFHFIFGEKHHLSEMKDCLLAIKKHYPEIKFYFYPMPSGKEEERDRSFMFLMYRYAFQKEIYKYRFCGKKPFNRTLFDWSIAGLLFGYSCHEIQRLFDENAKKFGNIFC